MKLKNQVRLSEFIKPERYRLTLKPDLEGFTFEGRETITLVNSKPTNEITLHSKDLQIFEVKLKSKNYEVRIKSKDIHYNPKNETVTLLLQKKIPVGKAELYLEFKGILNDKMRGFYRSRYSHGGKEKHLATTQFEATDARQAFPCFDEPAQKAVFDVTIMVPPGLTAISNTIESNITEHESGYKIVEFAPTPKMSTYLLAFIVGDFEFIEEKTKRGVIVRVFVTPGKKHQAKFALDTAVKTLDFYEKYFAINYPLPVLDMIAIPDFSHGAMENWGAVTYRESALLVDPEHSSAANKQWVALVIAHELAHQWFGNLVTMEWWTHLWLNEGFASYIEYLAVDHLFPDWDIWTQFAYSDLGVALKLDALNNTHPIEIEVHHPDEIGEIFDEVSYSKGASIIRMLANYIGEKNFRDGLRYYLKKHSYSNASTVHLWEAFEKISNKPVRKIMENWTKKPGYPVVQVTEKPKALELKQARFFSSPISRQESNDETLWQIPVRFRNLNREEKNAHLLAKETLPIPKSLKSKWTKLNAGETGFYRVNYPGQMLEALKQPVESKQLPPIDRLGIVRDAFALAESGQLKTVQALSLAEAYKHETDYTVWVELASGLDTVANLIQDQDYLAAFNQKVLQIFSPIAKKTGFQKQTGESHTQGLLRSLILYHAGNFGDKQIIEKARGIFKKTAVIPADIRSVVYNLAAENGAKKEYEALLAKYQSEQLSEEKNRIARALGYFKEPELLKKTLKFAISEKVRFQDTPMVVASVWANPHGKQLAWQFIKDNWKLLVERYPSSGHMLSRFIKPASQFNTQKELTDLQMFFKKHPSPSSARAINQVIEKIKSNIDWLKRDTDGIKRWALNQHKSI